MRALKGLKSAFGFLIPLAALLLVPAGLAPGGTWLWPQGLALLAVLGVTVTASQVALAVFRPASFEVRRQPFFAGKEKRQPLIDAVGLVGYVAFLVAWVAFIPLDVFSLHILPPPPAWLAAGGLGLVAAGSAMGYLAVWQNPYAAPTIHEQAGQQVVDRGVYGWVRHPLYAGNLMMFAGAALWLGSVAACLATLVQFAATLARIRIEEAHLRTSLPAYDDYARRVRGRLIPFVL